MKQFAFSKLTLALLSLGISATSSIAMAQQAEETTNNNAEDETEVIEVTGFRRSLIDAINQKRFADTVSEQISADDLGSLPDVSMADALTRLPGVAAVRTGGQAAEINIRGLGGGYVMTTMNGREQVSTSGKRSIEFDQYPSELISQASVYKSQKASLVEGGVAGSVELKTASPLKNEKEHTFSFNARGMYNDRASEVHDAEEHGHRLSFSYQGKFLDDTLGFAVGYARLYQPSVATQFIGLGYNQLDDVDFKENDTDGPVYDDGDPNRDIHKEYVSEGMELQHLGGEETRDGYVAAIEWQPSEVVKIKADAFISEFDSETFARGYRVKFGGDTSAYGNPVLNGNNMVGGTINRTSDGWARVETVNDDNQDFDRVESFGLNIELQLTEDLTSRLDFSYSKAESEFRNGLLWALVAEDATADTPVFDNNVSISYLLNGLDLPDVGFNQASALTDIDRVMVSKYGIYPFENTDELKAISLDFEYVLDNDFIASVEFGARYSEREYSNDRSVFEYGDDGAFSNIEPPLRLTDDMVDVVDWEGEFSSFPSYLAIDLDKALGAWFPNGTPQPQQIWETELRDYSWTKTQSGEVYEDIFAAYVMANINTEVFGIPLTGNIGVRMVETEQQATTLENVDGDATAGAQNIIDEAGNVNSRYAPKVLGPKYTDYLPSINLNFGISDNEQIRFAAAKVMARSDIERLAGDFGLTYNKDKGQWDGNANNNPFLKPFYANQYDLSYERYFEDGEGALAVAIFYKDIESFPQDLTLYNFNFEDAGYYVPDEYVDPTSGVVYDPGPVGDFNTVVNNEEGGYIQGLEVSYTQVFTFLPEFWSGLGINLNYSFTESEVEFVSNLAGFEANQPLPGLSENVLQTTLFWEYEGFEVRVSGRYRDEFVSEQWGVNQQIVTFDEELIVDFQSSYAVTENLNVLFQVNNLTDEPTQSYFGDTAFSGTTQYFGTQYFFGANYSF